MPTDQGKQNMEQTLHSVVKNAVRTRTRRLREITEREIHHTTDRSIRRAIRSFFLPVPAHQRNKAHLVIPIQEVSLDADVKAALTDATVADLVDKPALLEAARAVAQQRNPNHLQIVQNLVNTQEMQQAIENSVAEEMMGERGFTVESLLDEDYRATVKEYFIRNYPNFDPDFDLAHEMIEGKWADATQSLLDMLDAPDWDDEHYTHKHREG